MDAWKENIREIIPMIYIGIDPPKGFASWDADKGKLVELSTMDFWGIIERLQDFTGKALQSIHVVIEDSTQNHPVFLKTLNGRQGREALRIAQNVGANKCATQLIISFCELRGIPYTAVRPQRGSMTKLSAADFRQRTGWKGRSSEHSRDAAMLVVERN